MQAAYIFCKAFELDAGRINIGAGLYVAADSGIETAWRLGVAPDIIIGDFDSAEASSLALFAGEIIRYPAEKDDTDSMLCVKYALGRGCKDIVIVGGTGGRIDHTLANLALLKYIGRHGGAGVVTDGHNRVRYLAGGSMRVYEGYKYISVLPISRELRGVSMAGFKYNLDNGCVSYDEPYTVSNEIAGGYGEIIIAEGEAFICECG